MRKLLLSCLALVTLVSFSFAGDKEKEIDWQLFSKNLVKSLKSDNQGVRLSAMQLIIEYSNNVDVNNGVYDVMRTFRDNKDQNVRKLALVTLHKMNNGWAKEFLKMHYKFEENKCIKKMIDQIAWADQLNAEEYAQLDKELLLSLAK